jgi:predicted transcriptional regulator
MTGLERLHFLAGSTARWQVLRALLEESMTFRELRERLEVPQSTLNRNLSKLAEEGWVREGADRSYRLTRTGRLLVERLDPLEDVLSVVERLSEYPDALPLESFDFDPGRLSDATWRLASERKPYAALNRVRSTFREATTLRGFRPHYNPAYIDVIREVAERDGASVVGIVPDHQLDVAVADDDLDVGDVNHYEEVEFRVWEGDTEYGLAVVDGETVLLTGHHEGGMPSVLVESSDPVVLEWASATFDEVYDASLAVADALER